MFLLIFLSLGIFSQSSIVFSIKDKDTKEPLPFCSVAIKGTTRGGVTNLEGNVRLSLNLEKDTLEIFYLGYENTVIATKTLINAPTVFLTRKSFILNEVEIFSDDDYLFDIVNKCRKQLLKNKTITLSKVYHGIETTSNNLPLELVECYNNSKIEGVNVKNLYFKNGRVCLNNQNKYFTSITSSIIITLLNLTKTNIYFPNQILQFRKQNMKKYFRISLISVTDDYFNIGFSPKILDGNYFEGELWIDIKDYKLLKTKFNIVIAKTHPFIPIQIDSISNVSIEIIENFIKKNKKILPEYLIFNYSFQGSNTNDTNNVFNINSKCLTYLYDYDKPFILPFFDYNQNVSDYDKIAIIPYNEIFWNNTAPFLLTESQKEKLDFFAKFQNYSINNINDFEELFLLQIASLENKKDKYFLHFWDNKKRLKFNDFTLIYSATISTDGEEQKKKMKEMLIKHKFVVQILLDIVELQDSLSWKSYTVFDETKSFYYETFNENSNTWLNIFFDLCEIERLKMEDKLQKNHSSISEITAIYNETKENINKLSTLYFYDTFFGKEKKDLIKWNKIVREKLEIDNIQYFIEYNTMIKKIMEENNKE
ncbi:MAG: carboxypeptidase-like regulatory domain-containing protein [Bacteroidales bacterium]|nr:carboxypeptidase-like regulatory domain-containing protein [Bacteroidales bacterium]